MIETYDDLIEHFLNVFQEKPIPNLSERATYIHNYIAKTDTCPPNIFMSLTGEGISAKTANILHTVETILNGDADEDFWLTNSLKNEKKESNSLKNPEDFFVIIADNTQPSDYKKYLELLVPEGKRLKIVEHDQIGKIPSFLIDLVLFTGGEDVNPSLYGEKLGKHTFSNNKRDVLEEQIFSKFSKVPKLGICRGGQFLTVMNGGKLIQHVENHNSNHNITFIPSADKALDFTNSSVTIPVTSSHHQMMYPFNLDEDSYIIYGYSEYNRSPIYLNGANDNIKIPVSFVEPEVIYYPKTKSLCIQGHPEWMDFEEKFVKATVHLTKKLFLKNEKF